MCWLCLGVLVSVTTIYVVQCYTYPAFLRRAMKQYKEYAFTELTKKSISTFSDENTSRYISALTNDAVCIETNYLAKIFTLLTKSVSFVGGLVMMLLYSPLLTGFACCCRSCRWLFPSCAATGWRGMETGGLAAERVVRRHDEGPSVRLLRCQELQAEPRSLPASAAVTRNWRRQRAVAAAWRRSSPCSVPAPESWPSSACSCSALSCRNETGRYARRCHRVPAAHELRGRSHRLRAAHSANRRAAVALIDKLARRLGKNVRESGEQMDPVLRDGITIDHLTYGYHESAPVLNDVSVRFEAGKSYAIVGTSGSGKSTLVNLLMGSSNDYQGSIRFDQRELRSIAAESLYGLVSVVQQNVFIFDDTIRNNITMFRHFDEKLVQQATEKAGLTPLLAERGEDYICGEGGSGLSGGERQRISIARCLLRQTPVLLIDEATAALDAATAVFRQCAILAIEGLTRIVVTHRLEEPLLRKYDEILVLKNGEICERGSFDA